MPNNKIEEKITCSGISKNNMKFIDPFTNEETEKLNFDIFKKFNDDSQETFDVMGCNLYNNDTHFLLPDKIKRIGYNRTHDDVIDKVPMFSLHSTQITRSLFHHKWQGRQIYDYPYTIPHYNILKA